MSGINRRIGTGIIWMVGARLLDRLIGIISTLILARLLVPADFGLVAMATALGGVLDLLGAFSFDMALIQKSNAQPRHYNTVWTFNLIFGVACGVILIILAGPAANFYNEPRLTNVIYVLSISYFVNAVSNVGVVDFRKNLDFQSEFRLIMTKRVVTFMITVTAAFVLRTYWALLIGMTAGRIFGVILSYTMNSYRPRVTLSASRELFNFSKWLFLNNILLFVSNDACTIVIGRMFGAFDLGIYSISNEISSMPTTELVAPINRATFPGFSKMETIKEMSRSYLKLLGLIALLIVPVGIGIAAVAEPLVLTALGSKWIAAIPLIQILALNGALNATQGNNGMVWLAMGKSRNLSINMMLVMLVFFPSLYFCVPRFGLIGVGYAYLGANIATLPYSLYLTRTLLKFRFPRFLGVVWRPIVSTGLMFFLVTTMHTQFTGLGPLMELVGESLIGAVFYSATVLLFWVASGKPEGAETFCIDLLKRRFKNRDTLL